MILGGLHVQYVFVLFVFSTNLQATESLGKIWRLQWNITGTTLASSTEKAVCLWYQSSEKEWRGGPAEVKT